MTAKEKTEPPIDFDRHKRIVRNLTGKMIRLKRLIQWVFENHDGKNWALVCDEEIEIRNITMEMQASDPKLIAYYEQMIKRGDI